MARDLPSLLIAVGAGTSAGYNFDDHIPGTVANVGMAGYILEGWSDWTSSNYGQGGSYVTNSVLDFTFNMQAAGEFYYLRNVNIPTPGSMWINIHGGYDPSLAEIPTSAEVIPVGGAGTAWDTNSLYIANKIQVQLRGPYQYYGQPANLSVAKNWYENYGQYEIPYGNQEEPWIIEMSQGSAPSGSASYSNVYFKFIYPADPGSFNGQIVSPEYNISLQNRLVLVGLDWHWSSNSSFTDTLSTTSYIQFTTDPNVQTNGYVYLRTKQYGSSTWINYGPGSNPTGEIYWEDARYWAPPYNTP